MKQKTMGPYCENSLDLIAIYIHQPTIVFFFQI